MQMCALRASQPVACSWPMTEPISFRASLKGVRSMSKSDDNLVTTCTTAPDVNHAQRTSLLHSEE